MLKATLRSLLAHKLRLLLSGAAVVLGVAFVAGTLIFTDTLQKTFNDLFTQTTTDVVLTPKQEFEDTSGVLPPTASLPSELVPVVQDVDGVAKAEGIVFTTGVSIIGKDGDPVGVQGAPSFGSTWSEDPDLSPYRIAEGRGPVTGGEVAIDSQSAQQGDLSVGDTVTLITTGPRLEPTIVGIFRYGTTGNLAGASIVAFLPTEAQRILLAPDRFTEIDVKADPGVSQEELRRRIAAAVGPDVTVKTGAEVADQAAASVSEGLQFVNIFLLVFALVALFVGTFLILNTFSMLVAQRTRELGLLRAVGATRRQVTASVLGEAAIVGTLGGATGLVFGLGLATGLKALFERLGLDLPTGGLVLQPRTVVASLLLGLVVTVAAAYLPARRASRVPPVAALRSGVTVSTRSLRFRLLSGAVVLLAGIAALAGSAPADGRDAAVLVGVGALLSLIGVIVLAPALSRPAVRLLGRPFRTTTGRIAVQNAARNPRRTAVTASALMIGLALVTAFGILGASTTASTDAVIDDVLTTDYLVSARSFQPFTPEVAAALRKVDGVGTVSTIRIAPARIGGKQTSVTGVETGTISQMLDLPTGEGSLDDLDRPGIGVDSNLAQNEGYRLGETIEVTFPTGKRSLPLVAVYTSESGFSGYVVDNATFVAAGLPALDAQVYLKAQPGTDAAALRPALEQALDPYPTVELQDQTQLKKQIRDQIQQLLTLIYALLALAVLIAVLGIVNTLVLSVVERTREIGLLRAVGTTRRQLRRMIRVESVVIAVFGAILGTAMGLVFGVALQRSLADSGIEVLQVPWAQLAAFLVVSGVVGVLAAVWPARRAARLDVLDAIATE